MIRRCTFVVFATYVYVHNVLHSFKVSACAVCTVFQVTDSVHIRSNGLPLHLWLVASEDMSV